MKIKLSQFDQIKFNNLLETKEINISLADMYLDYLKECTLDLNADNIDSFQGKDNKDKFYHSFLSSMEINENDKDNLRIMRDYIYPGISELDPSLIKDNEYIKTIGLNEDKNKGIALSTNVIPAFSGMIFDDLKVEKDSYYKEITNLGFFKEDISYPVLIEDDVIWMSINPNEINTMKKGINEATGNVLTLGLGLGYYAFMVALKDSVTSVTIIENNQDTIGIFNKNILPKFKNKEKIKIINSDAFDYLNNVKDKDFDYIFSDIWHNPNDGISSYLKIKKYENKLIGTKFGYWLETGLICLFRRCLITLLEEEINGSNDSNYQTVEIETDDIINKAHFYLKNKEINSYQDIKELLSDESLKEIAKKI
jgi:hypothetical protein